jgi:hypothetical protein
MSNVRATFEAATNALLESIINGNFTVINHGQHTTEIDVEGIRFILWMANRSYGFHVSGSTIFNETIPNGICNRIGKSQEAYETIAAMRGEQELAIAKTELELARARYQEVKEDLGL